MPYETISHEDLTGPTLLAFRKAFEVLAIPSNIEVRMLGEFVVGGRVHAAVPQLCALLLLSGYCDFAFITVWGHILQVRWTYKSLNNKKKTLPNFILLFVQG